MSKPYVVSGDIYLLMKEWAAKKDFALPGQSFFAQLREEFARFMRRIFPAFEFVPEAEISAGITKLISQGGIASLSLDRTYLHHPSAHLDLTRLVDNAKRESGLGRRSGTPPLLRQFKNLKETGLKELTLIDDVIYSGKLIKRIIHCLARLGIRVPLVYAGIGISDGIKLIEQSGCEVRCVRTYETVIDEVCERDFYPGIPSSGRSLVGNGNIGLPYLLPFGDPEWASIPPEHAAIVSKFCVHQTISLFNEIERCSGKMVSCRNLDRKVFGLPTDGTRYTDALQSSLHKIP